MRGTIRAAVVVDDRRQPDRGVGDCAAPAEDGQVTAAVVGDPSTGEISPPTLESDSIVGGAAPPCTTTSCSLLAVPRQSARAGRET